MKMRSGFVSNSSSSSFVLDANKLTREQVEAIMAFSGKKDSWSIRKEKNTITGYTVINNYDEHFKLFKKLNIGFSALIDIDMSNS
jgi:hypothetical protein